MNCREAQSQIFAERDGALETTQRAALDSHLAQCDGCRQTREELTAALITWRTAVSHVTVPNAEREWQAVRRRIRGGMEPGAERASRPRRNLLAWIALPLGGVAAVALALLVSPQDRPTVQASAPVPPNSVEVAGDDATTMVFVDEKSGWLFVLASDANPRQG